MDSGFQTQWIPDSRYRIPVFLSVELGDRSLFIALGREGGAFDFWGDNLIFMRTKGGSLVTEKKAKSVALVIQFHSRWRTVCTEATNLGWCKA